VIGIFLIASSAFAATASPDSGGHHHQFAERSAPRAAVLLSPTLPFGCFAMRQLSDPASHSNSEFRCFSQRRAAAPSNKRLKLTGHRAFQFSVLPFGH